MIEHLSRSEPRRALDKFKRHLDRPDQSHSARTLEGLAWTFFSYRQPRIAFEAIELLADRGYAVSTRLAAKLLRSYGTELLFDHGTRGSLATVLEWIKCGIERDKDAAAGTTVDENVLATVLDALKRIGRADWSAQVFEAYRETLKRDRGEVGHASVWAAAISAQAAGGDVMAAQLLFRDWRTRRLEAEAAKMSRERDNGESVSCPAPPPEQPYLALLNHFALNSPPMPASKDPAYLLLELTKFDRLPPSTAFLNALLRTELSRKRFSSFWGIWTLFDDAELGSTSAVTRDHSTWKLAVRARLVSNESRRQRGRLHHSPLSNLSPVPYRECHTPTARSLFSRLVSDRLDLTSRRPSLRLSTSKPDPLAATPTSSSRVGSPVSHSASSVRDQAATTLLNSFLSLFLARQDFAAAVVVLETFHVHRVSPNPTTHSSVVLSIIKLWEKGKLYGGGRDRRTRGGRASEDLLDLVGGGTLRDDQLERERRTRVSKHFQGDLAIEAIRQMLERREFRINLWQRGTAPSLSSSPAQEGEDSPENELVGTDNVDELRAGENGEDGDAQGTHLGDRDDDDGPPEWMLQREVRDTKYLMELLERCSGMERDEWSAMLAETRKELLPAPTAGRDSSRTGQRGTSREIKGITRGARFRREAYGKPF